MQCEVCGSTEIRKVADGVFVCQGCGIQYDAAQVKKLLADVDDEAGNSAEESCVNEGTTAGVTGDMAQTAASSGLDGYFIIEADVDPKENVKSFLKQLSTTPNIACDVYKEISIRSVTEKYITFYFMKAKYQCDWSATACHIYYENQTVYKERYDSRLGRRVSEPVTEKVQRVKYVPQSGKHIYSRQELALASEGWSKSLAAETQTAKQALLHALEEQQDRKYASYDVHPIDSQHLRKENGKLFYKGLEVDAQAEQRVYSAKKEKMAAAADKQAAPQIESSIGGDYYENLTAIRKTLSESVACVCIPVQIIEYTYKGKAFTAVSDLLSCTTTMPALYPCDAELVEEKDSLKQEEQVSKKLPVLFWLGLFGFALGAVFLAMAASVSDGDTYGFLAIGTWILSVVLMIIGAVRRSRRTKAFAERNRNRQKNLYAPRAIALWDSYRAFMDAYEGVDSLTTANKAANVHKLSIEKTIVELSSDRNLPQGDENQREIFNEKELAIMKLEEEIEKAKKKRILPIVLMTVFGILIIPLFIGSIMLGNVNAKINKKRADLAKIETEWIDD